MASKVEVNTVWCGKLEQWREAISGGTDIIQAAKDAGFPAVLVNYLAISARDADFDAPLHAAENYYAALGQRRKTVLATVNTLFLTVIGTFIVGAFSIAMITSLADIIDVTCSKWLDV